MAKIIYTKKDDKTINKNVVLNTTYDWLAEKDSFANILLLAGKYPEKCVTRALEKIKPLHYIYLYENSFNLYYHIKNNQMDTLRSKLGRYQYLFLRNEDVLKAPHDILLQDLDFCSTFFGSQYRASEHQKEKTDPIVIIQDRLHYQKRYSIGFWKAMMFTITPRRGLGKRHNIQCINSIVHQLGWNIKSIDYDTREYGRGRILPDSGARHNNGGIYYAYEHKVELEKLPFNLDQANELEVKFMTYTDTQPMITFCLLYR
jgi:hypothetical protein